MRSALFSIFFMTTYARVMTKSGVLTLWRHKSVMSHQKKSSKISDFTFFILITLQKPDRDYLSPLSRKKNVKLFFAKILKNSSRILKRIKKPRKKFVMLGTVLMKRLKWRSRPCRPRPTRQRRRRGSRRPRKSPSWPSRQRKNQKKWKRNRKKWKRRPHHRPWWLRQNPPKWWRSRNPPYPRHRNPRRDPRARQWHTKKQWKNWENLKRQKRKKEQPDEQTENQLQKINYFNPQPEHSPPHHPSRKSPFKKSDRNFTLEKMATIFSWSNQKRENRRMKQVHRQNPHLTRLPSRPRPHLHKHPRNV